MFLVFKYMVPRGYTAITLYPFVFLKDADLKKNEVLLNHEKIHLKQQIELLVVGFYFWYVIEFLIRYLYYKSWHMAYKNISFEREAYAKENDLNYLKSRSFLRFLKYV